MKLDPVYLRQLLQWQRTVVFGVPVTLYWIFLQRQLLVIGIGPGVAAVVLGSICSAVYIASREG